ncbi:MAG: Ig-like domain-containing protein, partial [Candidatus Omnitrophica bacterium]|nr:Ig-like domain-containing protein [Candidatus Omnitrophota bacterium]
MKKQELGLLTDPQNHFITFSHVTTDALEAAAGLFGVASLGEMFDKTDKEERGQYLNGRRSWVGFTYIADFCQKMRKLGRINEAGAEESNGFSILGGSIAEGEVLSDDGHVNDKDGTFAGILAAEIACYAKENNTTIFELLDNIYLQIGNYATANKPLPRVGSFEGAEGITEKINLLKKAQDWMAEANQRAASSNPFMIGGLKVIGAIEFKSGRYDEQHYVGFPDEGVRFFFEDPSLQEGEPFYRSKNFITIRPSGTSQAIRFYTQIYSQCSEEKIAEQKHRNFRLAEALALQAQRELLNAAEITKYIPKVEEQLKDAALNLLDPTGDYRSGCFFGLPMLALAARGDAPIDSVANVSLLVRDNKTQEIVRCVIKKVDASWIMGWLDQPGMRLDRDIVERILSGHAESHTKPEIYCVVSEVGRIEAALIGYERTEAGSEEKSFFVDFVQVAPHNRTIDGHKNIYLLLLLARAIERSKEFGGSGVIQGLPRGAKTRLWEKLGMKQYMGLFMRMGVPEAEALLKLVYALVNRSLDISVIEIRDTDPRAGCFFGLPLVGVVLERNRSVQGSFRRVSFNGIRAPTTRVFFSLVLSVILVLNLFLASGCSKNPTAPEPDETTPPVVYNWNPTNNATNVAVNSLISVKVKDESGVRFVFSLNDSVVTPQTSGDAKDILITYRHPGGLRYETTYKAKIRATDLSQNANAVVDSVVFTTEKADTTGEIAYVRAASFLRAQINSVTGLVESYRGLPSGDYSYGRAYTFSQAQAIGALLLSGAPEDKASAIRAGNALVSLQNSDGSWAEAYFAASSNIALSDKKIGPVSAVGRALIDLYLNTGNTQYLQAAQRAADWMIANRFVKDNPTTPTYGRFRYNDYDQKTSTEENSRAIILMVKLFEHATNGKNAQYKQTAQLTAQWLTQQMWKGPQYPYFEVGLNPDGSLDIQTTERADSQFMPLLAFKVGNEAGVFNINPQDYNGLAWLEGYRTSVAYFGETLSGFSKKTLIDNSSFWTEGTAGVVAGYKVLGVSDQASFNSLFLVQDGSQGGLLDIIGAGSIIWPYNYPYLSVSATASLIFVNPAYDATAYYYLVGSGGDSGSSSSASRVVYGMLPFLSILGFAFRKRRSGLQQSDSETNKAGCFFGLPMVAIALTNLPSEDKYRDLQIELCEADEIQISEARDALCAYQFGLESLIKRDFRDAVLRFNAALKGYQTKREPVKNVSGLEEIFNRITDSEKSKKIRDWVTKANRSLEIALAEMKKAEDWGISLIDLTGNLTSKGCDTLLSIFTKIAQKQDKNYRVILNFDREESYLFRVPEAVVLENLAVVSQFRLAQNSYAVFRFVFDGETEEKESFLQLFVNNGNLEFVISSKRYPKYKEGKFQADFASVEELEKYIYELGLFS